MTYFNRLLILLLLVVLIPLNNHAQDNTTDSLPTVTAVQDVPIQRGIRKVSLENLQSPLDENGKSLSEATLVYNTNPETGKGLYYWNGSVWAQLMADDDGDPEEDSTNPPKTKEFLEALAQLLGALAWPATLLFILFLFRSGFAGAIGRIANLKVDKTGLSFDFNEEINNVKEVFQDLKEVATAKSSGSIQPQLARSPYAQLINLKGEINDTLDRKAREAGVTQAPSGIENRLDQLVGVGQMDHPQAEMVRTLTGLIDHAKRDVTQAQVNEISSLFDEINL